MELTVSDYRFKLRGQTKLDTSLSLVLVDQRTVKEYGFPFSRSYHAIVANALSNVGAKVVAFDYIFDQERPQDRLGDQMLVEVTSNHENIIHGWNASLRKTPMSWTPYESDIPSPIPELPLESELYNTVGSIHLPYPDLLRASDALGIVSVIPSADGSIREIPLLVKHGGQSYPNFALLIACRALNVSPVEAKPGKYLLLQGAGQEIKVPIDAMGRMLVNYTGDMMSLANISFSFYDVYESIVSGEPIVPASTFKDKVVIVGVSDPASSDICSTPYENLFPGVAVYAMAVNTILQRRFLAEAPGLLNVIVLLGFVVATVWITVSFRPWLAVVSTGILVVVLWFISYISFSRGGMMVNFVQPATGIILSFLGKILYGYHKAQVLKRKEAERIQAAKMKSLHQLVSGVAHEMNNPIGVISSNNDVSSRAVGKIKEILTEYPQEIRENKPLIRMITVLENTNQTNTVASERIAKIVATLRSFVRLDEAEWQITDIHEGIDNAIALMEMEPEFKSRIKVIRDYSDIPNIYCSPSSLNQVFMSLLKNASEAIKGEGEISIRTFVQEVHVKIEISDTGEGIPAKHFDKIFDPGFTTKGVKVGVGLGLSICYKIVVDEHKGRIDVSSELSKGTTFTITLPRSK